MSATEGMHPVDVAILEIITGGQKPVKGLIGLGGVELEEATVNFVGMMVMLTAQSLSKPDPDHGKEFFIKTGKRHALTFARGLARSYGIDAVCAELREKITDPEIVAATTGENADADFPFTVIFTAASRAVDLVAETFPPHVELTDQTVPENRYGTDWAEVSKGMIKAASRFGGESALADGWRIDRATRPAEPLADD